MLIDKERIATLLPHAGAMCLLDGVLRWDEVSIRCVTGRHRALDNPLRRGGRLAAVCGVELAAQAMAVHGRLTGGAGRASRAGYLASLRDLSCRQAWLDLLADELVIDAERLIGEEQRMIYRFALSCAGSEVLSGRGAVVLEAKGA